jgi:hypothetical protein
LHETEEELATAFRSPAIEPEREFIQVVRQVLACHCALEGAEQPALQQRSDPWTRGIN